MKVNAHRCTHSLAKLGQCNWSNIQFIKNVDALRLKFFLCLFGFVCFWRFTNRICNTVAALQLTKSVGKCLNIKTLTIYSQMAYCDLRVKIRNLSERWHSKEPKEKFRYLYGIPKWMFEVVGVRVYGDCHVNLFSHFGNILVVYYVSMVSYTIYYWYCKGQVLYGLRCLCGMGIMVSVSYRKFH